MNKKLLKSIMLLVVFTMVAAVFVGCNNAPADSDLIEQVDGTEKETIIMGTNPEFPPFEFIGDDGKVDGFDVALVKEIAKRMDAELKIDNMEFASLIGALSNGRIDLIAAGMTVTEDRAKEVDFTESYFTATQMIIVPVDSKIEGTDDLKGKVIGVQEGTTGDLIISEDEVEDDEKEYNVADVQRFKKGIDAVLALMNGRVDAVVIDSNPAKEYVKANEGKIIAIESGMDPEDYAIAVKKGNSELLKSINKAIAEIKEDGTYDDLVKEYIQ